jgi:exopolysaccharide biosynthesis WecB/TagA/CpsF family protein
VSPESNLTLKRILAVKLADIGDLILTTPALHAIRETYPDARLDVLTTPHAAPILNHTGLVDRVLTFDKFTFDSPRALLKPSNMLKLFRLALQLRTSSYDAVLIFNQLTTRFGALKHAGLALATGAPIRAGLDNGRGWFLTHRAEDHGFGAKHQAEYWLEIAAQIGAHSEDKSLHVGVSEADRVWAAERLPGNANVYYAVHSGSGGFSLARRWEPEKFAELINTHPATLSTAVLVGSESDATDEVLQHIRVPVINLAGKTTLNQLAAVLERCTGFWGADSGVMHIAGAKASAVAAIFGPSNHLAWQPWTQYKDVYRADVLCSPCSYVGHTLGLRHGCEARTCMKLVTAQQVTLKAEDAVRLPRIPHSLRILGVPIHATTFEAVCNQIGAWIDEKADRARLICTANPELIMLAQKDVNFYNILNRCHMVTPDGVGTLWAARLQGWRLPQRVTGSDGLPFIAARAAKEGWRIFLLGAAPGVAEKVAAKLQHDNPTLQIVGTYAGSPDHREEDEIAARVNAANADILFVAYGSPAQEKWLARNLPRLRVAVCIGVGGAFDFTAGTAQRAPVWMRRTGIEWLHRLIMQPWRWKRMTRLPRFVFAVLQRGSRGPVTFEGPRR